MTTAEPTEGRTAGETTETSKAFDPFELYTAVLLGLAAIGAALAGLQGGQWGGKQLEAFSAANTLTTKAATQYNEDIVLVNADYAAVARAKEHIITARDADDHKDKERHFELASYFYTTQMTEKGYKAMGLPAKYYVEDEEPHAGGAAHPPAAAAGTAKDEAAHPADEDIPGDVLLASVDEELDDDYVDAMLVQGQQMFKDADKKFEEGKIANDNGDRFELAGVFYTVALFFAGLALVFKTRARWALLGLGAAGFVATSGYMATLPWA